MRARRRRTRLPIPKSAESIQRHFFFLFVFVVIFLNLQMTQSVLNTEGGEGVCHFQNKPLLQCRATVNETTNISLSRGSWSMTTQVILM